MKRLLFVLLLLLLAVPSVEAQNVGGKGRPTVSQQQPKKPAPKARKKTKRVVKKHHVVVETPPPPPPERPKVGVVLGGGGARGAAHIGALKYIEEMGIPVDYVVGTSMGSIIGGLYALGYTPDELSDLIANLDWSVYMTNSIDRAQRSNSERRRQSTYLANIPFNSGALGSKMTFLKRVDEENTSGGSFVASLPSSFVGGSSLLNLFNSLSIGYLDSMSFDSLPIPFACVATNVSTAGAEVLRSGKFPMAIRASMAIPGVFAPVYIDGKLMMDGGLVNNFATDVCRRMGADIIIGVEVAQNLEEDLNSLQSLPQLLNQLMTIMTVGNKYENRKLCDVYIRPDATGYNMLSFNHDAIDTMVHRGYRAATVTHDKLDSIHELLLSYGEIESTLKAPKARNITRDSIIIASVSMEGADDDEMNWLLRKGGLSTEGPIKGSDVNRALNIFQGTGYYSDIECSLRPAGDTLDSATGFYCYDLNYVLKHAEPHAFAVGFRYDSQESASLLFHLGFNEHRCAGWRFGVTTRLGYNPRLTTTLTWAGLALANVNLSYDFSRSRYDLLDFDALTTSIRNYSHRMRFYVSEFHLLNMSASGGFDYERVNYNQSPTDDPRFYGRSLDRLNNACVGIFGNIGFDNLDDTYFATKGVQLRGSAHWRYDVTTNDTSGVTYAKQGFGDLGFRFKGYITPHQGRFTIIPQFYSRVLTESAFHFTYRNIVGGDMVERYVPHQIPFIGLNSPTIAEDLAVVGRVDLRYRLYDKHYLTLMANYLHSADSYNNFFSLDDYTGVRGWGAGLRYSINTAMGPVAVDVHWSDLSHKFEVYFNLGYLF